MATIKGSQVNLYLNSEIIACARNISINIDTSLVEVTSYLSDAYREFTPDISVVTAAVDGVMAVDSNKFDFRDIVVSQVAKQRIYVEFVTTVTGGVVNYGFYAYIQSSSLSGNFNEAALFSLNLQGTGRLSISDSLPPTPTSNPVFRLEAIIATESTTYVDALLIGKTVLSVVRGTSEVMTILTSGTPSDNEVTFSTGIGQLTAPASQPFAQGNIPESIVVLYK